MWSNIFSLAIEGLGPLKSQGSSLLVMAIIGGAILPCFQGAVADKFGLQSSFVVPMAAFAYIAFYGLYGYRAGRPKGIHQQTGLPMSVRAILTVILLAAFGAGGADSFPPVSELPLRPEAPDPLVMLDGKPVTTKKAWFKKRRPELKALFQHYMYGWFAASDEGRAARSLTVDTNFFGGKATLKLASCSSARRKRRRFI